MKSTHASLIVLFLLILLIGIFGRIWKLWEIESVKAKELTPKIEQLKKENENLKNENIILQKQVSLPYRARVVAYIRKVFNQKADEALAIISCENASMDMAHVNRNRDGSFDVGPFQINSIHIKRFGTAFMKDYQENVKVAYQLWKEQKWRPWYSSQNCHGLAYAQN